jgi:hypothetical protein
MNRRMRHAAELQRRLNATGWEGLDDYTTEHLRKGLGVLVSCPNCEDGPSDSWHMFSIHRNGRGEFKVVPSL